ncbi:MAG TPA: LysM peptidoglycan-binding domain-containing protein [Anaerolineales bacterium]|nr:LysM peptidoglycan-binding domain-containing protein [Anaerolineales bacterium]
MSNKRRGMLAIFSLVVSAILISACTQSLSAIPAATPTLLPPELFVSPLPSAANPMDQIAEFARQTAAAQTIVANGGTVVTTPQVLTPAGTIITPQLGSSSTPTVGVPSTPTNAVATTAVSALTTPSVPNATAVPPGVRPTTYTLQNGEFPYCIARRFNVDPDALLSASGLTSPDLYYPGLSLRIPQSGSFPGDRMLASHPTTYTVISGDETVYSVACKFGDVDPGAIASANGISTSANLTAGQALKIP